MNRSHLIMNKYSQSAFNLCLALFYSIFIVIQGRAFFTTHRLSLFFYILLNTIFLLFALIRKPAKEVDMNLLSWVFAIAGTLMPFLLMPDGNEDFYFGIFLQSIGIIISIVSGISLNRALGMVAANRGIKTGGMYRFVRHPLYFSYVISMIGFIVNNFSVYNVIILTVHIGFQIQRITYEERLLLNDDQYRIYLNSVKYRMFPYVY